MRMRDRKLGKDLETRPPRSWTMLTEKSRSNTREAKIMNGYHVKKRLNNVMLSVNRQLLIEPSWLGHMSYHYILPLLTRSSALAKLYVTCSTATNREVPRNKAATIFVSGSFQQMFYKLATSRRHAAQPKNSSQAVGHLKTLGGNVICTDTVNFRSLTGAHKNG